MKTILVPVERQESAGHVLAHAALAAHALGASIEGFALRRLPVPAMAWEPASVPLVTPAEWDELEAQNAEEARSLFAAAMEANGVPAADPDGAGDAEAKPEWRWRPDPEPGEEFLGSYARAFDLTVVARPGRAGTGGSMAALEAALFDSGGPILIAPPADSRSLGETVVVVWNGSSETARTIAFARPFLKRASRVVVLADDGQRGHRPDGELVRRRLVRNGIPAELELLPEARILQGEAILERAAALGCDLLVKGAYTQSRLRQMIFGGPTQHILWESRIPVLAAH